MPKIILKTNFKRLFTFAYFQFVTLQVKFKKTIKTNSWMIDIFRLRQNKIWYFYFNDFILKWFYIHFISGNYNRIQYF